MSAILEDGWHKNGVCCPNNLNRLVALVIITNQSH
jgi:hypothetical protein|tara:strand:- start:195 stop:299 length:105 start_codon:yes stop_codon:yes gene_type:complete